MCPSLEDDSSSFGHRVEGNPEPVSSQSFFSRFDLNVGKFLRFNLNVGKFAYSPPDSMSTCKGESKAGNSLGHHDSLVDDLGGGDHEVVEKGGAQEAVQGDDED